MADVRALLAREREARRIHHPHLSYSKSGALTCTICNLNVKSETLWEGHLKSANHRKNLQAANAAANTNGAPSGGGKKRKIEKVNTPAVPETENPRKRKTGVEDESEDRDGEGRKKRQVSFQTAETENATTLAAQNGKTEQADVLPGFVREETTTTNTTTIQEQQHPPKPPPAAPTAVDNIDESEWAAFTAEIAPLTQAKPSQSYNYSDATISAAPISAAELAAQQEAEERRNRKDLEAQDEKEESAQRLAEEFDVMEEMEARIKRLKEKREALRRVPSVSVNGPVGGDVERAEDEEVEGKMKEKPPEEKEEWEKDNHKEEDDDDDDEEVDDWYL